MMTDLYEAIRTITEQKRAQKRYPTFALDYEVEALYTGYSFRTEMQNLIRVGLIRTGRTINHRYYQIVEI